MRYACFRSKKKRNYYKMSRDSILDLLNNAKTNHTYVKVCAPMVRYSKVHFRTLVKNYGVDLCFTPMILADSFCQNSKARASEFSTTENDTPLVVQFAANNIDDFIDASKLVFPYADGVDLNCGCPQRWAMKDGYGCSLLSKPEIVYDLVRGVKSCLPNSFSVSVKLRLLKDLKKTIAMCKQLEMCGVNFLTIHGRTPAQKSSGEVNTAALKEICDLVTVPIIANGGVRTLADADKLYSEVQCDGVMAASGLLSNPTLFSGTNRTSLSCIKMWMDLKDMASDKITFQCYHHHLVFMLDKILTKQQKQDFNILSTFKSVDEFLINNVLDTFHDDVDIRFKMGEFVNCQFTDEITLKHSTKCRGCGKSACYCICIKYDSNLSDGNFFTSHVNSDTLDYMDSTMFDEVV